MCKTCAEYELRKEHIRLGTVHRMCWSAHIHVATVYVYCIYAEHDDDV